MKLMDSHGRKKQTNNRTAPIIAMSFEILIPTSQWLYFDIFQIAASGKTVTLQTKYYHLMCFVCPEHDRTWSFLDLLMASCNLAGCVDLPAHNVAVCMVESTPDLVRCLAKAELAELEGLVVLCLDLCTELFPRVCPEGADCWPGSEEVEFVIFVAKTEMAVWENYSNPAVGCRTGAAAE